MQNRVCQLFNTQYPIVQAGMIWCSGWELASAVSNSGALGVIGSGSMYPAVLEEHIIKCKEATRRPFAVNIPLIYPDIDKHVETIIKHEVPIVFSSAGNPKTWTKHLQDHGIKVVHVVSSVKFAKKSEDAGVDAVVAEGFEAGGHNGADETTTMCLIPMVREAIQIPVIAAGGIGSGRAMMAAMALGADAVQVGSRFVASYESSGHQAFKDLVVASQEGATKLTLKELTPVRMIKNPFFQQILKAYENKASQEELKELLGRGRAKKGMFEGNMDEGELEIGQVSGGIDDILPAAQIVKNLLSEFEIVKKELVDSEKYFWHDSI